MKNKMFFTTAIAVFVGFALFAMSSQDSCVFQPEDFKWNGLKISGAADRNDGIYKIGEKIRFNFTVNGLTSDNIKIPASGVRCGIEIFGDGTVKAEPAFDVTDAEGKLFCEVTPTRPGSIRCRVSSRTLRMQPDDADGVAGAVIAPEKIIAARPKPVDFDEYWEKLKKEIDRTPLDADLTEMKDAASGVKVYDLTLSCPGSKMPVTGYLAMPENASPKSLPAILHVQYAMVRSAAIPYEDGKSMLALEINANGVDNGRDDSFYRDLRNGELKDYEYFGMDNRDEIYFRDMFLRAYRALQFLKNRPEWDGRTLIVYGTSQGGGQALAAGGLDPDVSCVIATVPALCDLGGHFAGRQSGWPRYDTCDIYKKQPEKCAAAADYVDAVNFASRIKSADVFIFTGLIDYMCSSSGVCAAFNAIPSPRKKLMIAPGIGHFFVGPGEVAAMRFKEDHINRMK